MKLFVVTGPSGAGKGTLISALTERRDDLEVAISATTRPQRPGEEDGHDYYFLTEEEFLGRIEAGDFLEHVVYVSGQRYGTLRSEVARIHAAGKSVVLELETKGARAVRDEDADAHRLARRLRAMAVEALHAAEAAPLRQCLETGGRHQRLRIRSRCGSTSPRASDRTPR